MTAVQLSNDQQSLRNHINVILVQLTEDAQTNELSFKESQALFLEMGRAAHQLHMSLNPRPTHHRHMIENRSMQADNPHFYEHIHSIQDLLSYLDNTAANDDPLDVTIGDEFHMAIYSNRWGHSDRYTLNRTADGWNVSTIGLSGVGDQEAEPIFSEILTHESISYPRNIGQYMYSLWNRARDNGLSHDEVQELLNELAIWINVCEENAPQNILY